MQNRMKKHQLDKQQIDNLLNKCQVATIAMINEDGTPYILPIHYVYKENSIYFHGLPKGKKIDNIKSNSSVCFNVYEMTSLLLDEEERPCETNTEYQSVIISGKAQILEDFDQKSDVLSLVIQKYTPQLSGKPVPENMIKGTVVIRIEIDEITGKYYNLNQLLVVY